MHRMACLVLCVIRSRSAHLNLVVVCYKKLPYSAIPLVTRFGDSGSLAAMSWAELGPSIQYLTREMVLFNKNKLGYYFFLFKWPLFWVVMCLTPLWF